MDIDSKCYEAVAGAGLEPILQGGRGQASGFIMRMMAENKKKHQGQYRNPSDNNYGSTMNKFRAFDVKKLANRDQNGRNTSDYGASPFILKHFGSPEAVPFIPKAERYGEENKVIEGETEEQKAARLQKKAEELAEKAKELLAAATKKGKVKSFLSGVVKVRQAKKEVEGLKKKKEQEAIEKQKETERKKARAEFNKLITEITAYAKELRKEWSEKYANGVKDYLSYAKRGESMTNIYRQWAKKHIKERFGDRIKAIDKFLTWQDDNALVKAREDYTDGDTPYRGYNYKTLPYAAAKKIYDEFMGVEMEPEEEKKERIRGLKGVVRRLIRTKKALKDLTATAPRPVWWNGVKCVEEYAKQKNYSNMGKLIANKKWFGEWVYAMDNDITGNKFIFGEDAPEYPPEKKVKSEAEQEARNALIRKANEKYREGKEALNTLLQRYYEWVFKKALPLFDYKFIEYKPREEDFPKQPHYESREIEPLYTGRYTYDKTGDFTSGLRRRISGVDRYGEARKMRETEADVKPLPADFKLYLLVEPEGDFAWLISLTGSYGYETGELDWKKLVEQSLKNQGHLRFSTAFVKNGDHWKHLVFQQTEDNRNSHIPIKLSSGREYKWESSLSQKQLQKVIEPLVQDLNSRAAWDGTPLVKQSFADASIHKAKLVKRKLKVALPKDDEEELNFDEPQAPQKPPKGASWEVVKAYINATATGQKLERSVALYRHLHPSKNEREVAKETGVSQPSVNRWKNRFPDE